MKAQFTLSSPPGWEQLRFHSLHSKALLVTGIPELGRAGHQGDGYSTCLAAGKSGLVFVFVCLFSPLHFKCMGFSFSCVQYTLITVTEVDKRTQQGTEGQRDTAPLQDQEVHTEKLGGSFTESASICCWRRSCCLGSRAGLCRVCFFPIIC